MQGWRGTTAIVTLIDPNQCPPQSAFTTNAGSTFVTNALMRNAAAPPIVYPVGMHCLS